MPAHCGGSFAVDSTHRRRSAIALISLEVIGWVIYIGAVDKLLVSIDATYAAISSSIVAHVLSFIWSIVWWAVMSVLSCLLKIRILIASPLLCGLLMVPVYYMWSRDGDVHPYRRSFKIWCMRRKTCFLLRWHV